MTTRVVNVARTDEWDVYIGRAMPYGLSASPWQNPYKLGPHVSRPEAIEKYRVYLLSRPDLLARLSELRGKTLGCWCAPPGGVTAADPLVCHGQILGGLADALPDTETEVPA